MSPKSHVYLNLRFQGFHRQGDARNQTTSTDWDYDSVNIGNLIEDLQSNGSLARNNVGVVIPSISTTKGFILPVDVDFSSFL